MKVNFLIVRHELLFFFIAYWQILSFSTKITEHWASSKNRIRTPTLDLRKNGPSKNWTRWKNITLRPKSVTICLMSYERQCWSDSFFLIKSRGVQGLVSVQITFEECTANLHFEDDKRGINSRSVALISMKRFRMFMHFYAASFSIKACFYETSNIFYLKH